MRAPKTKFGKVINYFRNAKLARLLLAAMHNGYLVETGWIESFKQNKCIDENGMPIPWSPYSYINFLKDYLKDDMEVFEFGGGFSTLFFSHRVKQVTTVEHDISWANKLNISSLHNVRLKITTLDKSYEEAILKYDNQYDIIVVDGRRRINCIQTSIKMIKSNGIIVLDDSDRKKYSDGIKMLENNGFKQISFWGTSPMSFINRRTTIFFKSLQL